MVIAGGLLACAAVAWFAATAATRTAQAGETYGRHQFDASDREHWAFLPVKRPAVPAVGDAAWVRNPIDAFVLARLENEGIKPNSPADPRTLLRRVYLDLIGLPPTPDEQHAFLRDPSTENFARLVDRLLARPEYGERWGRHWLDVVRYAESNGYERDGAKPNAWRYRDWVIDALNADKPYDRFLIEQLAGDELPDANAQTQIATTFLRLGAWDDEPADPLVDRYDQLDDVVGTTCATFLAQTIRCARCHDHKFESFSQLDYSRMLAIFEPLKRSQDGRSDQDRLVGAESELAAYQRAVKDLDDKVAHLRKELATAEWQAAKRLAADGVLVADKSSAPDSEKASATGGGATNDKAPSGKLSAAPADAQPSMLPADALTALIIQPEQRSNAQKELAKKHHRPLRHVLAASASVEEKKSIDDLERAIEATLKRRPAEPPRAYIWYEDGPQAPKTHVWKRGNPREPLAVVGPGFPAILVDQPPPAATPTAKSTGRRLQLAQWLARPEHPLTARVMVNRIWQHHFGDGIVGSENDFGVMGQSPTHRELLDWLAAELVAGGWRMKPLHRLIVLSRTYQMSSAADPRAVQADPADDLLWRFPPRRLEAEAVRDGVLAVSGQLSPQRGGPSVYPEISADVLASQSKPGNGWGKSDDAQASRRSVYVFVKRTLPVPELEVLDFPDTNAACEQRVVSTVAPQALTWLNGGFVRGQARHFAERLQREAGDDTPRRIERAFELALCRPPTEAERQTAQRFLEHQAKQIQSDSGDTGQTAGFAADESADASTRALQAFCLVLLNTNEFVYLR